VQYSNLAVIKIVYEVEMLPSIKIVCEVEMNPDITMMMLKFNWCAYWSNAISYCNSNIFCKICVYSFVQAHTKMHAQMHTHTHTHT